MDNKQGGFSAFLARKQVKISFKRYFIDAMGYMTYGLFSSLLIGTIFDTIASQTGWEFLSQVSSFCSSVTGPAIAVAIGYALSAPALVLFSLCAVGATSYAMGGPLGTLLCAIIATEVGKLVSKETKIDILVTPAVTVLTGYALAALVGPGVSALMTGFGGLIMRATELRPFFMGILVSVMVGMALTLPISSAALCASLGLTGLAGGAATAGCCAQMIGFAVMSFRDNGWGGIAAQGLGTSKIQMGNIARNPRIWLPTLLTSAITGPVATCIFRMENGIAVASGMGTCGLVGPIGVMSAPGFGSPLSWLGLVMVCLVLPAIISPIIAWPLRKLGWIKDGDCKLDL